MARPRVFVSSTYYDLKHARASLEAFITTLGFDPVLSEKGDIPYRPDRPLDDSCYAEVMNADIFVLIIGGRYGSVASAEKPQPTGFYEHYNSITKNEYRKAFKRGIPIFVLVESGVHAEHPTFRRNSDNTEVKYAFVDSVNVYRLLDEILDQHQNNPVYPFDRITDAQTWLREQWSGLFRDSLRRMSQETELAAMRDQIEELQGISQTMKHYLEEVLKAGTPNQQQLVQAEQARREGESNALAIVRQDPACQNLIRRVGVSQREFLDGLLSAKSIDDFADHIDNSSHIIGARVLVLGYFNHPDSLAHINAVREKLGLVPFAPMDQTDVAFTMTLQNGNSVGFSGIAAEVAKALDDFARKVGFPITEVDSKMELIPTLAASELGSRFMTTRKLADAINNVLIRIRKESS